MDSLMTIWVFFVGCIVGFIIGVMLSFRTAVAPLHHSLEKFTSGQRQYQKSIKYYPYNPDTFRFIGDPVDGIQFEEDTILFVRFKTRGTSCTTEEDHIKYLLEQGKVGWFEFPIE